MMNIVKIPADLVIKDISLAMATELTKRLPLLVVYDKPLDYPEKVVVRLFDLEKPTPYIMLFDTVAQARERISEGFMCIPRSEQDDPNIVESWI